VKKLIDSFDVFVFDLDNTLVFTNFDYIYNLIKKTINNLGGIIPDKALAKKFWYAEIDGRECIWNNFKLPYHRFWHKLREYDIPEERTKRTEVMVGVNSVLQSLKDNNKKLAIITNAYPLIAIAEIRLLAIKFNKDNVLALGDNTRYTPKPHRHSLDCLREVYNNQTNFVYIGDSHGDALFAKNSETPFVHFNINNSELPSDLESLTSFNDWQVFNELLIK